MIKENKIDFHDENRVHIYIYMYITFFDFLFQKKLEVIILTLLTQMGNSSN